MRTVGSLGVTACREAVCSFGNGTVWSGRPDVPDDRELQTQGEYNTT